MELGGILETPAGLIVQGLGTPVGLIRLGLGGRLETPVGLIRQGMGTPVGLIRQGLGKRLGTPVGLIRKRLGTPGGWGGGGEGWGGAERIEFILRKPFLVAQYIQLRHKYNGDRCM
jgi:hypothetical protein